MLLGIVANTTTRVRDVMQDSEVDEDERVVVRQLSKVRVEIESAEEAAQGATGERISGDGAGRSLNVARNSLLAEMLGEMLGGTWKRCALPSHLFSSHFAAPLVPHPQPLCLLHVRL